MHKPDPRSNAQYETRKPHGDLEYPGPGRRTPSNAFPSCLSWWTSQRQAVAGKKPRARMQKAICPPPQSLAVYRFRRGRKLSLKASRKLLVRHSAAI